ncbi:MAG: Ig-like domain-containing protein [Candidatus Neomarinimicrobiota bacterium]
MNFFSPARNRVIICIYCLVFLSCAAVGPPGGGDVDIIPPELIQVTPDRGSSYFKGGRVRLLFSEYIAENTMEKSIRVSPRLNTALTMIYKGKEIWLNFPEDLSPQKTYVITISRNLKDEHGISLAESIQIAYSTGDYIDLGIISGKVMGPGEYALHLWAATEDDSIFSTAPLYVSETDENGQFYFQYLAPGDYVLLALERQAGGLPLNTERMVYGLPPERIYHLDTDRHIEDINIRVRREPIPLGLLRTEWPGQNWGWIYFNREIKDKNINLLEINDGRRVTHPAYFRDSEDPSRFLLLSSDSLSPGKISIKIEAAVLEDSLYLSDSLEARIPALKDTSALVLVKPASLIKILPDQDGGPALSLIFSKPVKTGRKEDLILIKGRDTVDINFKWSNPMHLEVSPVLDWQPNTNYVLEINTRKFIPVEGKPIPDSLIFLKVNTGNQVGYGGLLGTVERSSHSAITLELRAVNNSQQEFIEVLNSDLQFRYNHIPEGNYQLILFEDLNRDGHYSFGKAYPFEAGEWFFPYSDSIKVRANWDIEVGPILLNKRGN